MLLLVGSSVAQNGSSESVSSAEAGKRFAGERLIFEGRVSRFKISMAIADLTFTAVPSPGSGELVIRSEAVSKGTMLRLFRYSFLQEYESVVDLSNFRIVKTVKHDVQKQRVRDSQASFDYGTKRVTYIETDPKDTNRPPRTIASEISDPMNDMVSAIYAMRLQDLAVGKKFELLVSDSGLVYKVPVAVTARRQLSTSIGKVMCLRVEPGVFGPGRLIEGKGKMVLWITDDDQKLPVKAEVDSQYGKVEIKLKSVSRVT